MFTVYAIKSRTRNFTYVGLTSNLQKRLIYHDKGYEKSTKAYRPFDLIYSKAVSNRSEAREMEKFLKSGKGREYLKVYK